MEYAVTDIETTGGYASGNGITEIAIYIYNGNTVTEQFETLINPGHSIPLYITALTGIDNKLVSKAPSFNDVSQRVYELLNGRVFVAHNVNFDYTFIKHHLAMAGYDWQATKLCTLRLSRKLLPGYRSYSLGNLCRSAGIPLYNQHRAGGDASATVQLFELLLQKDTADYIPFMLRKTSKEQSLPPNLPRADFDALPMLPGVYYFKDAKGKVIYVGKAKNLRSRVASHFSGQNPNPQRQHFLRNIHAIAFERCGTELIALLLEAAEIKRLWPAFNRAMKRFEPKFGLYTFEDQKGYLRIAIDKHKPDRPTNHSFNNLLSGINFLNRLVTAEQLCPKLCLLQKKPHACTAHDDGTCQGACIGEETPVAYNKRVSAALDKSQQELPSFALMDHGRHAGEQSCLWIEKGQFYGMGYIEPDADIRHPDEVKEYLVPYQSNHYMMQLIMSHANQHPEKIVRL